MGEIMTNVATNLIEDSIRNAWEKVKHLFKDLDDKMSIKYRKAYEEYIKNTKDNNSKIKTIIYRRVPKDLYSFYECIGVSFNGQTINTDSITNLIENGNKIIITGTGGIGKSILFKHLFLNTIESTLFIPVIIELRSLNIYDVKDISLYKVIYKSLSDNGFNLDEDMFEYSMKKGGYIIFFDGYDEVNRDKTEKISKEIKELSEKYRDNKYFLSSRPSEEFIGWNDFLEMETMKLEKEQALNLIKKIEFDEAVKETFYKELQDNLFEKYESFASNPLLLNIMLLTFQKHASIPERLNDFYDEAFVTLYNVHDATKDSFVRDIRSGLGCEDFKLIFSYICFKSYFYGEFEFSETKLNTYIKKAKDKFDRLSFSIDDFREDLTASVCMLVKEGLVYNFSHRSFQEYFAAWYTCKLLDEEQSKLLLSWIKESDSVFSDSYFNMLFDLQSEKVNKIILCPILKQVCELYEYHGFSIKFLKKLFDGIRISRRKNGKNEYNYNTLMVIKNDYLCKGMILNIRLNNYKYSKRYDRNDEEIYNKFAKSKTLKYSKVYSFEEIIEIISEEELLKHLEWIKERALFSKDTIKKYEEQNISRKKKVASIIDEL